MIEHTEEVFLNEGFTESFGETAYGFQALMGRVVELWGVDYIYHGKLAEIRLDAVRLEDASIIFDTGSFDSDEYARIEKLTTDRWVKRAAVESYCEARIEKPHG